MPKQVQIVQVDEGEKNLLQLVVETDDAKALSERLDDLLSAGYTVSVRPWDVVSEDAATRMVRTLIDDLEEKEYAEEDEYQEHVAHVSERSERYNQ